MRAHAEAQAEQVEHEELLSSRSLASVRTRADVEKGLEERQSDARRELQQHRSVDKQNPQSRHTPCGAVWCSQTAYRSSAELTSRIGACPGVGAGCRLALGPEPRPGRRLGVRLSVRVELGLLVRQGAVPPASSAQSGVRRYDMPQGGAMHLRRTVTRCGMRAAQEQCDAREPRFG